MEAQNAIYLDEETGGKGRQFKSRFLVPGLVKYDYGVCLLTKENADKFIQGFVGCPVVINHQTVTDDNAKAVSVGNIFSVWFDEKDGYYWCNGIINDKEAIDLINKGYSVSCQYTITEYSDNETNALHNGNPYDKIIENGKPEHLAIVNNPRYEGAKIAVNAIMAQNAEKWITIHPHGEESDDYRRLKLEDGESPKEAIERTYGKTDDENSPKQLGLRGFSKYRKEIERNQKEIEKKNQKERSATRKKIKDLRDAYDMYIEQYTPSSDWAKQKEDRDFRADLLDRIYKAEQEAIDKYNLDEDALEDFLNETNQYDKQPDTKEENGEKKEETKVYTEENYNDFHKKFYEDYGDKWYINQEKGGFYVDKTKNGIGKSKIIKNNEIDEYLKDDVIRLRLNNKKKTSKDGNTNFVEDTKSLQKFLDSGYIVSDKYNDGYKMNYILQKPQLKRETEQIKNDETSKDFVKRILNTPIEKYKPTSYTIDWGSLRSQKQGKRSNGMVTGSMGDMTLQGEKEYKKILGGLPEYEEIKDEFNGGGLESEQMKVAYLKAREAGFNKEESLDFAYTIFEPENTLYKKLKKQTASNSFVSQFKDALYEAIAGGIYNRLGELIASNEDKWITIHPHGEESDDYRRLLIKDGETVEDAMHRQGYYNKRQAKDEKALKEERKQLYQDILKAKREGNKELHHKLLQRYKEVDAQLKGQKIPDKGKEEKKEEPKKEEAPKDDKEILKKIEELAAEYKKLDKEYWNINYQDQDKRKEVYDKKEKVKEELNKIGTSLSMVGDTWKNADGETVTFKGYDADSRGFKVSTTSGYSLSHYYFQNYSTVEQLKKADTKGYEKAQKKKSEETRQTKPNKIGGMPKAKSVIEAEQLAKEYGLAQNVNFGKLSLDICNAMNESANDNLAEFPEIRKLCIEFGSLQGRNKSLIQEALDIKGESISVKIKDRLGEIKQLYGEDYFERNYGDTKKLEKKIADKVQSRVKDMLNIGRASGEIAHCKYSPPSQRGIVWNEKFKDAKDFDYTVGFHPEGGTSLKAICDHEFGHQINKFINDSGKPSAKYTALKTYYNSLSKDDIKNGLSGYATTNMSEWIAEGWAEYKNNPKCRPMAKKIGQLLTETYKEITNG